MEYKCGVFRLQSEVLPESARFYEMEKSKEFSIINRNGKLFNIHSFLVEEESFEFITLFELLKKENKKVFAFEKLVNNELLAKIIRYMYLKEFEEASFNKMFDLLDIVLILNSPKFISEIFNFLVENLNTTDNVFFILKNCLNFEVPEQIEKQRVVSFENIIYKSINYLAEHNAFEEFFKFFEENFLKPNKSNCFAICLLILSIFAKIKDIKYGDKLKFMALFIDNIKYSNAKEKEKYIQTCLKMHIGLDNITIDEFEDLFQNYFIKSDKVLKFDDKKVLNLKYIQTKDNLNFLVDKYDKLKEEKNEVVKELGSIMKYLGGLFKHENLEFYQFISSHFNEEFEFDLIFNSDIHGFEMDKFESLVPSNKNLLFYIQTVDDLILGSFYTVAYPKNEGETDLYFEDKKSFLFYFNEREIYAAYGHEEQHLKTHPMYLFCHGYHNQNDGIWLWDKILGFGKSNNHSYDVTNSTLFINADSYYKEVKSVKVFKLLFGVNEEEA